VIGDDSEIIQHTTTMMPPGIQSPISSIINSFVSRFFAFALLGGCRRPSPTSLFVCLSVVVVVVYSPSGTRASE